MTLVVDASALVSALTDSTSSGAWVRTTLRGQRLVAPALIHYEVGNTLRRHAKAQLLTIATASQAHEDFLRMRIALLSYRLTERRAWSLRENFTIFDGSYIAAAELVDADLVTLDARLPRGPGPQCGFLVYPGDA